MSEFIWRFVLILQASTAIYTAGVLKLLQPLDHLQQPWFAIIDGTETLQKDWSNILIDTLLNLVDSLPRIVEAVIAAKGWPTQY